MIAQVAKEHSKNAKVLLVHDWGTSVWSSCTIHPHQCHTLLFTTVSTVRDPQEFENKIAET